MEDQGGHELADTAEPFGMGSDRSHDVNNSEQTHGEEKDAAHTCECSHVDPPLLLITQCLEEQEQCQDGRCAMKQVSRVDLGAVCADFAAEHVREDVENSGRRHEPDENCCNPPHDCVTSCTYSGLC
jgi:hypothetical protein